MDDATAPRLLIHVGLPKAASTTLQRQVFPALCKGREATYLGKSAGRGAPWEPVIAYALRGEESRRAEAQEAVASFAGRGIFSSEDLSHPFHFAPGGLRPVIAPSLQKFERLAGLIPAHFEVMLLAATRAPADWLPSFYVECVKRGYTSERSIKAFWTMLCQRTDMVERVLDDAALEAGLRARLPSAQVAMIDFATLCTEPAKALGDALRFLRLDRGALNAPLERFNGRDRRSGSIVLSGEDRRFVTRRLMLQLLGRGLSLPERLSRARLLADIRFGPARRRGFDDGGDQLRRIVADRLPRPVESPRGVL